PQGWRTAAASPTAYTVGCETDRSAGSTTIRPCGSTARPASAASGGAVNPVVHSTASARTSSPPASSTAPGSTLVISTPARTSTPSRSSALVRYPRALADIIEPGTSRLSSTTCRPG